MAGMISSEQDRSLVKHLGWVWFSSVCSSHFQVAPLKCLVREPLATSLWQSWLNFFPCWLLLSGTKSKKQLQGAVCALLNFSHCVSPKTAQRFPNRKWYSHPLVAALEIEYVTFVSSLARLQSQFLVQFPLPGVPEWELNSC